MKIVGGWQVLQRTETDSKNHVFRVMDQDRDPVIVSGQHVGSDVSDVVYYRSWAQKPGIFAFDAPNESDVLDVCDLDELAEVLDTDTRSREEWRERWEDVPHVNHVLGMDEEEVSDAVRKAGYEWIRYEEPSGITLGYVGEKPLRGYLVAKDVDSKPRYDERDKRDERGGIDLVEEIWGNKIY